ncbi:MAG TPA: ATP-binding protein [Actinomycetota bacterium]|nr:ATP-binding protein [Actinomycetota bacterium]
MRTQLEGRQLIRRFAVGSLAAFLATGIGVAVLMAGSLRDEAQSEATVRAKTVALSAIGPLLTPSDLAAPSTGARYQELQAIVWSRIISNGTAVRVKVWRSDGTILFSDDLAAVGHRYPESDLQEAARGELLSHVSDLGDPENVTERPLGSKLFETYVPFRFTPGGPVVAVVEVYQSYADVQREIDRLIRTLALAFGGGLAALYLVLLPIAMRSARNLRERSERQAQQAEELQAAEAKYRTLVEQVPAIVYMAEFEAAGVWLYVSPQIGSILGFSPEEWTADPTLFDRRLHPEDEERYRAEELRSRQTGTPLVAEYRLLARDGHEVWFHDEARLIVDQSGRPRFHQGILFDITQAKRAEETLRMGLEREKDATERLRALDQMRNTFLQAVSHELRTPLTSVLGFALTLQRGDLELSPDERADMMERLAANARKLERLLSDLLDVDRLARGVLEPSLHPVDLGELTRRVADETDVGARSLVVETPRVEAMVDGAKIERIVENLLVNAARHTPEGARIWIRLSEEAGGVLLLVEDDGPGVPDDQKESVFEPFHQAAPLRGHNPGTGIGLSLVSSFAELHGGRAWVQDRPGGGASFHVFLPTSQAPRAAGTGHALTGHSLRAP